MILLEDWNTFYLDIGNQFSSPLVLGNTEIIHAFQKLNELINLYYDKELGVYAYHKRRSILINMVNNISMIENALQKKIHLENKKFLHVIEKIKSDALIESHQLKILSTQQEIEIAIDSGENDRAKELLHSHFVIENAKEIVECLLFKYCNDIKEEVSSILAINLFHELKMNFNQYKNYKGFTPLMEAADNDGKLLVMQALIDAGADVNLGEKRGNGTITALHLGAVNGKSDYVEFLLSHGAKPNNNYYTLSFLAEKKSQENLKIINLLMSAGISIDQIDPEGYTPIQKAIYAKNTEVVKLFLKSSVIYNDIGLDVIKSNNVELLAYLRENYQINMPEDIPYYNNKNQSNKGSNISLSMFQYCLEMHMSLKHYTFSDAVVLKTSKAVKICLERKDSLDIHFECHAITGVFNVSENGSCSLAHFAATCAAEEPLAILILAGLDISVKDQEGRTPLHYAAAYANPDAVKIFILASADINAIDSNGKTPLHWALEHGMAQS